MSSIFPRRIVPLTAVSLFALAALSACNQPQSAAQNGAQNATDLAAANSAAPLPPLPAALPMQAGPVTPPAYAPPASALPAARPVRMGQLPHAQDAYAYVDRAAGFTDAIGSAPPDYAFDYQGTNPWVWEADDDSYEVAEPVDGGYRSYYYEPGSDYPYLIRDPGYSYAYAGGALVAVYDVYGRVLDQRRWRDRADYAARYYARAEALRAAAQRGQRRGVVAANWAARRGAIDTQRNQWAETRNRDAAWQSYAQAHQADEQAHWQGERARREQSAQRFDQWHRNDFRGPPPQADAAPPPQRPDGARGLFGGRPADQARIDQLRAQQAQRAAQVQQQEQSAQRGAALQQQRAQAERQAADRQQAARDQAGQRDAQRTQQLAAQRQQIEAQRGQAMAQRTQAEAARRQQMMADRQQAEQARRQQADPERQREQIMRDQQRDVRQIPGDALRRQAAAQRVAAQREQDQARQNQARQQDDSRRQAEAARHEQQAAQQQAHQAEAAQRQQQAAQQQAAHQAEAARRQPPSPPRPPRPEGNRARDQ